jgi:hypothetical protein
VFGALALVAGVVATIGFTTLAQQAASAEPAIPASAKITSWADNGKGGERVLQLIKGDMPVVATTVAGVVKTDTNCDPDAEGINHCHNVIGLASGGEIEVIHNHMMMAYECLSPGQKLTLTRLDDTGWLVATDAR